MSLADKIRDARKFTKEVDGRVYTLRRPTDAEAASMSGSGALSILQKFVIGWDHTEVSLDIPGGSPSPAEFSSELWAEWVADQPQLWEPLSLAIIDAYQKHSEARKQAEKN